MLWKDKGAGESRVLVREKPECLTTKSKQDNYENEAKRGLLGNEKVEEDQRS